MKIIGFTGAAGAGKDTAAGFALEWCRERGVRAQRFAFADPLKVSAARALGCKEYSVMECIEFCNWLKQPGVELHVHCPNDSELGPNRVNIELGSGRQFLQWYGTEAHREVFGSNFWVEVTERKLNEAKGILDVAFLTDPRFENEAAMIHAHDGEVWQVLRPGQETVESHASEVGLPESAIDLPIINDGTLDNLRDEIRLVCEQKLEATE